MKGKKRAKPVDELGDVLHLDLLPSIDNPEVNPLDIRREERWGDLVKCVSELVDAGCQSRALWVSLHLAQTAKDTLEGLTMIPPRESIGVLSAKMKKLADEIIDLELFSPSFLVFQQRNALMDLGIAEMMYQTHLCDSRFTTPYSELPYWLRVRAKMYDDYLASSAPDSKRKNTVFARLTHLYPALYVDYATKKQHFPKVRQLLNFAELASAEMSDSQLSRELGEFKACYPNTTAEIIARFSLIENGDIEYRCKGYVIR